MLPRHIVKRYTGHIIFNDHRAERDVVTVYLKYGWFTFKTKFIFCRRMIFDDKLPDGYAYYSMSDACEEFLDQLDQLCLPNLVDRKHLKVIK